jgi:glycerophosphoryl diester phosphodiesterase
MLLLSFTEGPIMTKPKVFAHRGGRLWAPENTLAAFAKSLAAGVDGIELDVQRCKTGELVVIHDENLARTTDGAGIVGQTSFTDIRKFSAGAHFAPEFAAERVPLLSEVLTLIGGKLVINIEIKNAPTAYPGIEDDVLALLKQHNYPLDTILFSSFDHALMPSILAKEPKARTVLLFNGLLLDFPGYARLLGVQAWHPQFTNLRADAVQLAHTYGLEVNGWTLNTPDEWSAAQQMGLDAIITDDPVGLQAFLK